MKNTKKQAMMQTLYDTFPIKGEFLKHMSKLSETALAEIVCSMQASGMPGSAKRWVEMCKFKSN